jgi:hypothetical protein
MNFTRHEANEFATAPGYAAPAFAQESEERIDAAKFFIAEEFTPLFHTPEYRLLPDAARLRYNQLHALYFNEQIAFFEQEMLSPALRGLLRCRLPAELAKSVQIFHDEEQQHSAMFRALNRRCAPGFYARSHYHFISITRPLRALLRAVSGRPREFPLIVWLALMHEERSLFFSTNYVKNAGKLETHFVATHRAHLTDEVGHVGWDGELLDWLWPLTGRTIRSANVRLLVWMVGEFFLLPKRSGLRVVAQIAREFPHLDSAALLRAMSGLKSNGEYLCSLYSREMTPRTFARFDALPEFALIGQTLPGYVPAQA